MNENKAYGDNKIYSPDGKLMFLTGGRKLDFYINKKLVQKIGDKSYKLLFEPKGKGHSERNTSLLEPRENKCVVCGELDLLELTRHHIIPSRFRKYFPENIKGNNYRYVVFVCNTCHNNYGQHENLYNDVIAKELGIKNLQQCNEEIYLKKRIIIGIANALLFRTIPEQRNKELQEKFVENTGLEPTEKNLFKVHKWKYEPQDDNNDFGKLVVDNINNIYEFQQRWLEHFVECMKPQFLPKDLKILL